MNKNKRMHNTGFAVRSAEELVHERENLDKSGLTHITTFSG